MDSHAPLSPGDRERYSWQIDVAGLGESGQARLRNSAVLVSRVGGLGGPLALSLASAGVGKIVLAHAGNLREDDLNRQILMGHAGLGSERAAQAAETIRRYKDDVEVVAIPENLNPENAAGLVAQVDLVCSAAPLFEERLLMNREAGRQGKFCVDAAMFDLQGQVLAVRPGETACLACLVEEPPPNWKRRFPVIGAVSALVGQIAAIEAIKLLSGLPDSQAGTLIHLDTTTMDLRKIAVPRRADCPACGDRT